MTARHAARASLVAFTLCVVVGSDPAAQAPQRRPPAILIESLAGVDSFAAYCAPCHGSGGLGDGPVAAALRTPPEDLTSLARRNGGAFPRDAVRAFVTGTGRALAAHGTTEMPVWGPMFRAFESDARARQRITSLVAHIETIQGPSTAGGDTGSQLFRTHCASCHGTTGRGNGPVASQLRRPPPDLTRFTTRNGGVFPRERVYRIVDGADVPSHGDRDMPVWGDIFKRGRGGASPGAVKTLIDGIVRYLEGIQERPAE